MLDSRKQKILGPIDTQKVASRVAWEIESDEVVRRAEVDLLYRASDRLLTMLPTEVTMAILFDMHRFRDAVVQAIGGEQGHDSNRLTQLLLREYERAARTVQAEMIGAEVSDGEYLAFVERTPGAEMGDKEGEIIHQVSEMIRSVTPEAAEANWEDIDWMQADRS